VRQVGCRHACIMLPRQRYVERSRYAAAAPLFTLCHIISDLSFFLFSRLDSSLSSTTIIVQAVPEKMRKSIR